MLYPLSYRPFLIWQESNLRPNKKYPQSHCSKIKELCTICTGTLLCTSFFFIYFKIKACAHFVCKLWIHASSRIFLMMRLHNPRRVMNKTSLISPSSLSLKALRVVAAGCGNDGKLTIPTVNTMTTYSAFTDSGRQICTGVDINEIYRRLPAGARLMGGAKEAKDDTGAVTGTWTAHYRIMDGTRITVVMDQPKSPTV